MNLFSQTHFTQETPLLLQNVLHRDSSLAKKLLSILCSSSELQLPQMSNTKMKLSELMDTMIQKPRNLFQQCFDQIEGILANTEHRIVIISFLEHFEDHHCVNVLMLLYKLIHNNSLRRIIYEEGYFGEIVEKFENALIVPNSMYHKLSKLSHDGDFHMNLTKFLLAHYPNVYAKENEEPNTVQVVEQTQANKNFKIPPLKLPQPNLEVGVMTRSTRRADPFKSYSTCSNRFSHSIDSAIKFTSGSQALHIKTGEGNQSAEEISMERKKMSAREELFDLANQMGGYCLTQDLSCLLSKQRRQQLESLTRLGLNTIPSILKEQEDQQTESIEQIDNTRIQKNRICRLWGNVVYMIAKDIKQLQYELCPSSSILNYLCSNSFLRNNNQQKSLNSRKLCIDFDIDVIQERNSILCDNFEKNIKKETTLMSEHQILFKLLDIYNNEKIHLKMQSEILRDNSIDNDESERSIEVYIIYINQSPHTVVNIPELMIPVKSVIEIKEIVCNYRHTKSKNLQFLNQFLKQFQMRFQFILSNFDMSKNAFYEQEADHLKILDYYLSNSSGRIVVPQFLDYMLDILLMIKRQIVDYTNCQLSSNRTPHPSQYQSKSAKHYSQTINNMFKPFECSPQEEQRQNMNSNQKSQQKFQLIAKQPFIQKHPSIVSAYISIIARLQLKSISNETIKFFVQIYMNESFLEIIRSFCIFIFSELNNSQEEGYELHGMRIVLFLESGLLMLQQKTDKELKPILRNYLLYLTNLLKVFVKFVEHHIYLLNNKHNLPRIQLFRKCFSLFGLYFTFERPNEELAASLIRLCYVNFIKIYSQSNLNDLRDINQKIQEYNNTKQIQPSSKQEEKSYKHWNIIFMNMFIKTLFFIASNRSDEISRKFYQYRIVEFLTNEIDLEFDITQIKEKQQSQRSSPQSNNSSIISADESNNERLSSKISDRPPKLNLNSLHKQQLEEIVEENTKKQPTKMSQNLLKKVLVPKLDLDGRGTKEAVISQSYSHSPQFNTSAKQLQNLTALFKCTPEQESLNHKRGNSMPFKNDLVQVQLSESQRILLQKNLDKKSQVPKLNLQNCQEKQEQQSSTQHISEDLFYFSERKLRKIYADKEMHANCVSLLLTLLIKPSRGTLDELYCSQHPIINGKQNILFILHHHLNHQYNQSIIKIILPKMILIKQYPVGQRLLKLLCTSLFDINKYTEWSKIASGAYGVIYQCKTNLQEPEYVAIKQMSVPKSIYERCVLHGLFTELACMENFRLNPNVATVYDYGVTSTDYVIVMKKYQHSLKEWRLLQKGTLQDNLANCLQIYKEILQTIQVLHSHNITHYDIKADNILLEYGPNKTNNDIHTVITDFGESRIFSNEEDEYCARNRGTEYIKSPEMLTLTINSKKEQDNYDRRKKVGTTRSSDVWSLGCLLFEILTGELLFYKKEWVQFYLQVTQPQESLITEDKQLMLNNNFYLIDFLKYVLVRDQKHRPNIENVLKRFEHVHALLVTNSSSSHIPIPSLLNIRTFDQQLDDYHRMVYFNEKKSANNIQINALSLMKLTNEIFISDKLYFQSNIEKLITLGITNVVSDTSILKINELIKFQYVLFSVENITQITNYTKAAQLVPHFFDYLKLILLHRGKLLIVENHASYLRQALLLCLSSLTKLNLFETLHLFNNQVLFLNTPNLNELNQLSIYHLTLSQQLSTYPKLQCICGCSTLILKRDFNDEKRLSIIPCKCHGNQLCNGGAGSTKGCANYLKFLRKRYKLSWDSIKWGYIDMDAFLIGPFNKGQIRHESKVQLLLNSMGPNQNLISNCNGDWKVYECRICHMWMVAHNKSTHELATIINNQIKKSRNGFNSERLKIPNLKSFNLYELK